jgi:transcriptional regulator with XRE-family HTH domain
MDIEEFTRQVGIKIQALRKKQGLSQEAMAEAIDKSTDTVSNIERGFSSTRIETMYRIAAVLGVPIAELFDVGPPRPIDRNRRKLLDQMIELVAEEDCSTIEAVIAQTEILLHTKARAMRLARLRT